MWVLRDRDLSLDFPKAQKGRVRTVLDCLAHFTHKETVEMRCEKCGKLCDFEKRLRVKRRPPVLVRTPTTCVHSHNLRADLVKKLNLRMTKNLVVALWCRCCT